MFNKKEDPVRELLDENIVELLQLLKVTASDDPEYPKTREELEKLYALRDASPESVNPNTLLLVGGNLAGILMIIGFEKSHVMTTKALAFLGKLR